MIIYFAVGGCYEHNIELSRKRVTARLLSYFYIRDWEDSELISYIEKGVMPAKMKRSKKVQSMVRRRLRK